MRIRLEKNITQNRVQTYPDKDGTFAMTTDVVEHYRGTDHTAVVNPVTGDYTIEASGVWHYGTDWKSDSDPQIVQGGGTVLYFTSTSGGTGYEILSTIPDLSGIDEETITLPTANTPVYLNHQYIGSDVVGSTSTPAGQWGFNVYAKANHANHETTLAFDVGTTDGTTTTWHFTATSPAISSTLLANYTFVTVQSSFACSATDKYVIRIAGVSDANNQSVTWTHSSTDSYSSLVLPATAILHNTLTDLNTGDYQHITSAEKTRLGLLTDRYKGHYANFGSLSAAIHGDYATFNYTNLDSDVQTGLAFWDNTNSLWWQAIDYKYLIDRLLIRDKRSYVGSDHTAPTITPTAGAYTVEAGGLYIFDGTTWSLVSGGALQYFTESLNGTETHLDTIHANKNLIFSGTGNSSTGNRSTIINGSSNTITSSSDSAILGGNNNSVLSSATGAVAMGSYSEAGHSRAVVIGYGGKSSRSNQLVVGNEPVCDRKFYSLSETTLGSAPRYLIFSYRKASQNGAFVISGHGFFSTNTGVEVFFNYHTATSVVAGVESIKSKYIEYLSPKVAGYDLDIDFDTANANALSMKITVATDVTLVVTMTVDVLSRSV